MAIFGKYNMLQFVLWLLSSASLPYAKCIHPLSEDPQILCIKVPDSGLRFRIKLFKSSLCIAEASQVRFFTYSSLCNIPLNLKSCKLERTHLPSACAAYNSETAQDNCYRCSHSKGSNRRNTAILKSSPVPAARFLVRGQAYDSRNNS